MSIPSGGGRTFRLPRLNYVGQNGGLYCFLEVGQMTLSGVGLRYSQSGKGGILFTLSCIDTFSRSIVSLQDRNS